LGSSAKSVQFALPGTLSPLGAKSAGSQSRSDSLANAIIPVVDNGDLFFQDGRTLYAVDSANESPLAGWLKTYPGEREGRFKIDVAGQPRKELLTVTVSPELVLAVMGQLDRLTLPVAARGTTIAPSKSTVRLVCLDRNSGRELWTRTTLDLPEAGTTLNHAEYDSTPLIIPREFAGRDESGVLDDSVLVTARTGRQNQFDECYLVCMSLKSGQYRWSTYLGGATHDTGAQTEPSQMTFSDGRVFVMTNLGAVAAIDPSDGRVIWLNSYPHDAGGPRQNILLANSRSNERPLGIAPTKAWAHNPVICCDGKVFVLPNDARNLFVCDASSGSGMNYFPLSYWGNADLLLGVQDDCVILNSQTKVFAVDWRKYLSGNNPSDATRWTTDISFIDGATTCGRGFATTESIFVPTTNRLVQITNGRARATYPVRGIFSEGQGPGNLLVTRSAIVVAGQKRIDIYRCPSVVGQR
jgi:outer membrane protein assembly factor BamB